MAHRRRHIHRGILGSVLLLAPIGARAQAPAPAVPAPRQQQTQPLPPGPSSVPTPAVTVGYEPGEGFFLKSADGRFTLNLSGYAQTWGQMEGPSDAATLPGVVDGQNLTDAGLQRHEPSTFRLRRTRLRFTGQVPGGFGFYIEPELAGSTGARLQQGWARYTGASWATVFLGQRKPRFGLEELTSARDLDFAERSIATRALAPGQQVGATVEGSLRLARMPVTYGVGLYNGCGRVDQCQGGVDNDGAKEVTWRATFSPPVRFGALTVGVNADHRTFRVVRGIGSTDPNSVTRPIAGTPFHRFNPIGPTGITLAGDGVGGTQDGFRVNGDRVTCGADVVLDVRRFIVKGEYVRASQARDGLGDAGAALDDLVVRGGYASIGYRVSGNRQRGLLLIGRVEHLRAADSRGAFTSPQSAANEVALDVRSATAGLTWYVNPNVRVRSNYILTGLRPSRNAVGMSGSASGEAVHQGIAELQFQF